MYMQTLLTMYAAVAMCVCVCTIPHVILGGCIFQNTMYRCFMCGMTDVGI